MITGRLGYAALLCLLLAVAGCTSFAHPIVGDSDDPFDRRLVGQWDGKLEEDERTRVVIRRNGHVHVTTQSPHSDPENDSFRARTARVAGFAVVNIELKEKGDTYWQPMRYEVTDSGELRIYLCNDDTWSDAVSKGELEGKVSSGQHGTSVFVSASSTRLLEFVQAHRDSVFVDEPVVLRRTR